MMAKEINVETKQDVLDALKDNPDKQIYMLQVASNSEQAAKRNIIDRLKVIGQEGKVPFMFFPAKKLLEMKNGQKKYSLNKIMPGYLLVLADISEEVVVAIHSAGKVMKFLDMNNGKLPKPMREKDFKNILSHLDEKQNEVHVKEAWEVDQVVSIKEGPFATYKGTIKEVNLDRHQLKVSILIFGRETPIEVSFNDVEKYQEVY